jgi:hypothetical protein
MKYAIQTLEIEKARLLGALRAFGSLPVVGDDFPYGRFQDHEIQMRELDRAIHALKQLPAGQ